jgi:hypothetical protein
VRIYVTKPNDAGGCEAAALLLRLGRAGKFKTLCKNSDAAGRRALPPVERAEIRAEHSSDAHDVAGVFARCGRSRGERRHEASISVMGGLWTEHIKGMRSREECDHGTSVRDAS